MNETKSTLKNNFVVFGNLRVMLCAAIFAALSIILGKFLAINIGPTLRISFENTPIILSGIFFGPVVGVVTGVVADLVGCVAVGYTINPLVTLGAAVIGLTSGIFSHYIAKNPLWVKVLSSVAISHIIGSVLIKTIGLAAYQALPLYELMLWRLLVYAGIGTAEFVIIFSLLKSKVLIRQLDKMMKTKGGKPPAENAQKRQQADEQSTARKQQQADEQSTARKRQQADEQSAERKQQQADEQSTARKRQQADEQSAERKRQQANEQSTARKRQQADEQSSKRRAKRDEQSAARKRQQADEQSAARKRENSDR